MTLAGGTAVSQMIVIAVTPFLTRLYSPTEFGIYSVFTSVLAVVGAFSTGRYEFAIIAEGNVKNAWHCLGLVVSLSSIVAIIVMLFALISIYWIFPIYDINVSPVLVPFVGFSVFLMGSYIGLYKWHNRFQRYRLLSLSRLVGSVMLVLFSVVLGVLEFGVLGLIIGLVAGQLGNLIMMTVNIRHYESGRNSPSFTGIVAQARKHFDYPRFLIPSGILDRLSSHSMVILFSGIYGASVSGGVGLYQRAVSLPVKIVGSAISDVFKQRASVCINETGECRLLFYKTAMALAATGVLPFIILLFAGPLIFGFIFGDEWKVVGSYAQILSFMFFFGFVVSPLSSLFFIANKQKIDLIMQIILFPSVVLAVYIGSKFGGVTQSLLLLCIVYCIKYIIEGTLAWCIANGRM